jgi:non-homologous end joining protein Ku
MEMIQRKVEGQDITQADAPADGGGKIIDLMEALKASLAATSKPEAAVKLA